MVGGKIRALMRAGSQAAVWLDGRGERKPVFASMDSQALRRIRDD